MPRTSVAFLFLGERSMYLCYIDESGTPEVPGNTSHFVLCGLALPVWHWHDVEQSITSTLKPYGLHEEEFHTTWLMRPYLEQTKIKDFAAMNWADRRKACQKERNANLLALQKSNKQKLYKQFKKNYRHSAVYMHLTFDERKAVVKKVAERISGWGFSRLFAECIDKLHFDETKTGRTISEQAFEQVVSRFEQYVAKLPAPATGKNYAVLAHDRNETVATKHTNMMRDFHKKGTLWTDVNHIIETPFFVDSGLTRMVQMADVCSWALRRYCENGDEEIFKIIFPRAHRIGSKTVGVRHYTDKHCKCAMCASH